MLGSNRCRKLNDHARTNKNGGNVRHYVSPDELNMATVQVDRRTGILQRTAYWALADNPNDDRPLKQHAAAAFGEKSNSRVPFRSLEQVGRIATCRRSLSARRGRHEKALELVAQLVEQRTFNP